VTLRRTPLRAQPQGKGNRGEREVIDLLHRFGWKYARRNLLSGGLGGGDIVEGPEATCFEVKYVERTSIWEWWAQAKAAAKPTDTPVLAFRRNRSEWLCVVPLDDLLEMLRLRESA
jgi:Holliday junction resolvase